MSDFNKNILVLLSGTTIAQALPILLMPILTRLYTPEEFGVLALFVAVSTILGAVANARYELALTLPESEDEAISVAGLAIAIATVFSIILLIPFVVFNAKISALFDNGAISIWLYFVPLIVWVIGVFNVYNFLNTRLKHYKDIATAHVYRSAAMVALQLLLGVLKLGSAGLVLGQMLGHFAAAGRAAKRLPIISIFKRALSFQEIKQVAVRFRRFFVYMLPATIMNSLSSNFITLYLPTLFSITTLGFYSLAQRALGAPSALIGASIGQVYMQEASAEKIKSGVVSNSFATAFKKLLILALLIFVPLFFVVEDLFAFVFGEEWRIAGSYTKILIPYFSINFIVASLSVTDSIMEKQYIYAAFNTIMLFGIVVIMGFYSPANPEEFFTIISSYFLFVYLCYLFVIYMVSKGRF